MIQDLIFYVFIYLFIGAMIGGFLFNKKESGFMKYLLYTSILWPIAVVIALGVSMSDSMKFCFRFMNLIANKITRKIFKTRNNEA